MKTIIVDERISKDMERALSLCGFNVLLLPHHPALGEAVRSHPDSLIFKHKNRIFTPAEYCDLAPHIFTDIREAYPNVSISFTADKLSPSYPLDTAMNALVIGERLFARTASLSPSILGYAEGCGLSVTDVKQGYPACSVLVLSEDAAITSDRGLARSMEKTGVRVTLIEQGHIELAPHQYGFIGGASFVHGKEVYFFGNASLHPSYEEILSAAKAEGLSPVFLGSGPLRDLGGAVLFDQGLENY